MEHTPTGGYSCETRSLIAGMLLLCFFKFGYRFCAKYVLTEEFK